MNNLTADDFYLESDLNLETPKPGKSQKERILKYLKQGNTLTPRGAIQMFNCYRLSARIFELRHQGERIDNIGKKFAEYKWVNPQTKASDNDILKALEGEESPREICERLGFTKQAFWERLKRLYLKRKLKGSCLSGWYAKKGRKQADTLLAKWGKDLPEETEDYLDGRLEGLSELNFQEARNERL